MRPEEFLQIVHGARQRDGPIVALGTIPAGYAGGRPQVQFDGESAAGTRTYPYLSSYAPAANDRILLVRVGNGWVVIGKIV